MNGSVWIVERNRRVAQLDDIHTGFFPPIGRIFSRSSNHHFSALYNGLQCASMTSQTRMTTSLRTWPHKHKCFHFASACGPAS